MERKELTQEEKRMLSISYAYQAGTASEEDVQWFVAATTQKLVGTGVSEQDAKEGKDKVNVLVRAWRASWEVVKKVWNAIVEFFKAVGRKCMDAWKKLFSFRKDKKESKGNVVSMPAPAVANA